MIAGGKRLLSILKAPIPEETRSLLRARWRDLPPELQTDHQVVGRHLVHCGYTLGAPYCSFGCTHCYLPANANRVPTPSLAEMKAQVDANRQFIGQGGGLQLTGGDVVDAYWKSGRAEELVAISRYANDRGVVPMLMTHGQVLLEHPQYLERLVVQGGLRKLALHIDTTQAGRPGFPIRGLTRESDLHRLRDAFVDLILNVRRKTGVRFHAAHTVTVTERNIDSIGDILRWLIDEPRRLRAFRMVSFQTETDLGRTRISASPVTPRNTWEAICTAVGQELPRDNLLVGHPDCNNMTTLLVVHLRRLVINAIPADERSRAYWARVLRVFGGVGARGEDVLESVARKLGRLARHPGLLIATVAYLRYRMQQESLRPSLFWHLLRGRVNGLNIVMHNFMSASELAEPRSARVCDRLAACSFRGATRRNGTWEAVPMCEMNATVREPLYASTGARPRDRL